MDKILSGNTGAMDAAALSEDILAGYGRGQEMQMNQAKNLLGIEDLVREANFKRTYGDAIHLMDLRKKEQELNLITPDPTNEQVAQEISALIGKDFNSLSQEEKIKSVNEQIWEQAYRTAKEKLTPEIDYSNPNSIMEAHLKSNMQAELEKFQARQEAEREKQDRQFRMQMEMFGLKSEHDIAKMREMQENIFARQRSAQAHQSREKSIDRSAREMAAHRKAVAQQLKELRPLIGQRRTKAAQQRVANKLRELRSGESDQETINMINAFTAEAAHFLSGVGSGAPSAPKKKDVAPGATKVTNRAQVDALPPGAVFEFKGKMYQKLPSGNLKQL